MSPGLLDSIICWDTRIVERVPRTLSEANARHSPFSSGFKKGKNTNFKILFQLILNKHFSAFLVTFYCKNKIILIL